MFQFNLANYAFGLTHVRFRDYFIASFVRMAPGALAYTYLSPLEFERRNQRLLAA